MFVSLSPFSSQADGGNGQQREAHKTTASLLSSPLRRHSRTGLLPTLPTILKRSLALIPLLSFEALKFLLPTSIFFFRFLEWWYSSEGGYSRLRKKGSSSSNGQALRAPPPPKKVLDMGKGDGGVRSGICVVHNGELVNPTALPSGYLGCYKCLFGFVEEHGICPVSGVKVELSELRKIVG